jgi:hypothetical protein
MKNTIFTNTFRSMALMVVTCILAVAALPAEAGGRNNRNVQTRNTTATNFSGNSNRNVNVNNNRNVNVNNNRNVNVNRNYNTNVNVNRHVDVDVHHRGYYGGCCYNNGPSFGAVVAATVTTAIVVGAIYSSLPPNCTTIIANGVTYQNCGGHYYQPQYSSGNVTYIVVNHP